MSEFNKADNTCGFTGSMDGSPLLKWFEDEDHIEKLTCIVFCFAHNIFTLFKQHTNAIYYIVFTESIINN